ncbi:unnamed protein product [Effrenium voratum]|uniref:MYND-type domain-containing protein n=1 Tax=Effrenium voratum TaxID=2562239 RepID=A0AA36IRI9_9DINO|nr:unnamed protein product [Effrenium voratum]
MAEESLAILPRSMGQQPTQKKKAAPRKFIPSQKGALITDNPLEEECAYSFSDSPAYLRQKKAEDDAKRAAELEGKEETRGFLKSVEDLAHKQKWEEAFHVLEKRTAVPSGLFLVTRALLRWKFYHYSSALRDAEEALKNYGSSTKAGPLAAALASFARLCLGSEVRDKGSCSKELRPLLEEWEQAEDAALKRHALGQGLFKVRQEERLSEPVCVEGMQAEDGTYPAGGVRLGYVLLKNQQDATAPFILHFHGSGETAADYRRPQLAEKYRDIPVHLLVADYRGYGWSAGEPSLATFLKDAEALAEKLPELFVQHGLAWPYPGGLILSGRSLGAQVAVHLAVMFPTLFRAMVLDSAMATSATGDRLGDSRLAVLKQWRKELENANLEVLQPLDAEMWTLGALDKIRAFNGQLLLLHGLSDDLVPYEGSESLHAAAASRQKEIILIKEANHNNIGQHQEYWHSLRRFALKVQLDSSLPSVGPAVEHLCAVCAQKAVSKCGRCQKVWYCSRSHQADHWKTHKVSCQGGAEPTPKVVKEAEASLIAVVAAEITSESLASLRATLASVLAQDQLKALYISFHASELAGQVESELEELQKKSNSVTMKWSKSADAISFFEHVKAAMALTCSETAQAWVSLVSPGQLWSSRYSSVLLPTLRRAAADPRVLAVRSRRCARLSSGSAAEVDDAFAGKMAELSQDEGVGSILVLAKTLQAFLETSPVPALQSDLCAHRFAHKMLNAFGKKVLEAPLPEGEWMRSVSETCQLPGSQVTDQEAEDNARRGEELVKSSSSRFDAPEAEREQLPTRLRDASEASEMIGAIRTSISRRFILRAGEAVDPKDLRELSEDLVTDAIEAAGLDQVIGIQSWARKTALDLAQAAAEKFEVKVRDK